LRREKSSVSHRKSWQRSYLFPVKQFQELKLKVLKNLVRDHGVGALCFEMDYGEGVIINDYISGHSDMTIEELFRHFAFDIYHTEQMKDTIEWMKSYNDSSRDGKLSFYGFDLQNSESDLFVIKNFVIDNGILSEFDLTSSDAKILQTTVTKMDESVMLVTPIDDAAEIASSDCFSIPLDVLDIPVKPEIVI